MAQATKERPHYFKRLWAELGRMGGEHDAFIKVIIVERIVKSLVLIALAIGLIFAGSWTIAEGANLSTIGYVIAAACTLLFWKSHINPIPIIVVAGMLGWMRLI